MTTEEKKQVRLRQGNEAATSEVVENDTDCPELAAFLALLPQLSAHDLKNRSSEFWLLLRDTLHDRRENYFQAAYKWGYMHRNFAAEIPAMWVRRLQRKRWAANDEGDLKAPHEICLSDACHEIQSSPNAFLAEILGFRPEAIKELAEKEGIDLETLNLLKRHKVTAEQLRELLGAAEDESDENEGTGEGDGDTSNTEGDDSGASDKEDDADDESENASEDGNGSGGEAGSGNGGSGGGGSSGGGGGSGGGGSGGGSGSPNKGNGDSRTAFYTYVGLNDGSNHEEDENLTPDERRNIEEAAISFILSLDGNLQRTPTNNPGFDLFEGDSLEYVARFVEVKSKKGAWNGAVALSEEQFRLAATEGERFWLYVVEFAQDGSRRRLHKIQDPAGHTRYYTFDAGWKAVAEHQNSEGQTS